MTIHNKINFTFLFKNIKSQDSKEKNSSIQKDSLLNDNIIYTKSDIKKENNIDLAKKEKEKEKDNNYSLQRIEDERIEKCIGDEMKTIIFIDASTERISFLLKKARMRNHYYKDDKDEIFSYKNKSITNIEPFVCHCGKKNVGCCSKIIIYNHFSGITLVGFHAHNKGIVKCRFYKRYPFLSKEMWKHVQIFEMSNTLIAVRIK